MAIQRPLSFQSRPVERVWGGQRLVPDSPAPIGELWILHEENVISEGPHQGQTLAQLVAEFPEAVLGHGAPGDRFPLLLKLLDCAQWLSVQVHPDDEQAVRLEGAGTLGKTEAWHILDAAPGARLITGIREGVEADELQAAVRSGQVMKHVVYQEIEAGDSLLIPAGTVHALGPGTLLYEVQQSSDVTYRIYDWDRPQAGGRSLHLSQSAEVSRPFNAQVLKGQEASQTGIAELLRCDFFILERLSSLDNDTLQRDTVGQSFHALTLTRGEATLECGNERFSLTPYQSLLLPADLGPYRLHGSFEMLSSRLLTTP